MEKWPGSRSRIWSKLPPTAASRRGVLMLGLSAGFAFGKSHVKGDTSDNRLPSFVLGKSASFDRTPQMNDLFFRHTLEKILIRFPIER